MDSTEFLTKLSDKNADTRYKAVMQSHSQSLDCLPKLVELLTHSLPGIRKSAKASLLRIAHYSARPGNGKEAASFSDQLISLIVTAPINTGGYLEHVLGFTGGSSQVTFLANRLELQDEEARMALERIPGSASLGALKRAVSTATPEFRIGLLQSIRMRETTNTQLGVRRSRQK